MLNQIKYLSFFVIVAFAFIQPTQAQHKYLFDVNNHKKRRVSVQFFIQQSKEKIKEYRKIRKKNRTLQKESKKIRKHIYGLQTREVKKRMRKSLKKAEKYNRDESWLCVTIKKLF